MKNLENSMKTQFVHFNFTLKFSYIYETSLVGESRNCSKFPTFIGKIEV
jgi:hypothetical protein